MKTTKTSVIALVIAMILIVALFRPIRLYQVEREKTIELEPQLEQIRKQKENLENENISLKKQISLPYRDKVVAYIRKVFGEKTNEALAIVACENSSMDMARVNYNRDGSSDYGPFQISDIHVKRFGTAFMKDYKENIKVAYALFQEQSWRPWYSSKSCWQPKLANK